MGENNTTSPTGEPWKITKETEELDPSNPLMIPKHLK